MSNQSKQKNMNCFERLETLNEKLKELARVMGEMNQVLRELEVKK